MTNKVTFNVDKLDYITIGTGNPISCTAHCAKLFNGDVMPFSSGAVQAVVNVCQSIQVIEPNEIIIVTKNHSIQYIAVLRVRTIKKIRPNYNSPSPFGKQLCIAFT